ncbi:MAG: DNA-processing protein DprA [Bacteroidaceae bacterium]|nr:DNA-processing protein DprA [Bacteroidaceae bacterium]
MTQQEIVNAMALTYIKGITQTTALQLYQAAGSATAVLNLSEELQKQMPTQSWEKIKRAITEGKAKAIERAETEWKFCEEKNIQMLTFNDDNYPYRLREISDAPLVLFHKGTANLNAKRIISVVGTRKITEYGKDICRTFLPELQRRLPDTLILSGLAYGVDICAHRICLENHLPTVGILAHGLDRIYPSLHRDTAAQMTQHGGVLTEYMSMTTPDKGNFVRRNRIVAGMADATIVVESAEKGGALITANLAFDYARDVFAFPGRTTDKYSQGCNKLIAEQKASLITSADDFIRLMNWEVFEQKDAQQLTLFPVLSADEQKVWDALEGKTEGVAVNALCVQLEIPIGKLMSILTDMEMKGWTKAMSGGKYKLLPM